jgi:Xaa-Pro aminopeptidase
MPSAFALVEAQAYLRLQQLDAWLLVDFHHNNPVFWQVIGERRHTTRRAFLLIPATGDPQFLLHMIDATQLDDLGWPVEQYLSRADQDARLAALLHGHARIAMEYSPACSLPVVSRVDAGTVEQIRGLGIEIVSSGDVLQYAVARWSPDQLVTHERAAAAVVRVAREAFDFIGLRRANGVDELAVREFIEARFAALGLVSDNPPDVAVNAHASDPHYAPTPATSSRIATGDLVLIDLWAKERSPGAVYGDTTWVAVVGRKVDPLVTRVFDSVLRARDHAVQVLQSAWQSGRQLEGWEVDAVARASIERDGYSRYFTHRLGHSLGEAIHSNGVNLDGFETHDTRRIISGVGFSVEPGIYLPEFGVRLEINVYVDPTRGPIVTTPPQTDLVLID